LTETDGIKEIIKSGDTAEAPPPETAAAETGAEARDIAALTTKPFKIRRRIGSTTYEVEVRFNQDSHETLDDKILRLARGEALNESGKNK
jgi:hypothetical protein